MSALGWRLPRVVVRRVIPLASVNVIEPLVRGTHSGAAITIHFEEQSQDLPEMREAQEQNRQEPTARGIDLLGQGDPLSCRVLGGKYSP